MEQRRKYREGCNGFYSAERADRRDFLRVGALGLGGLTLGQFLKIESAQAEQKWYESKENTAKSVIQIFLPGGCAHQESWDPKPEAPLEYRGAFGVAKTPIPGIVFSENMKHCAKIADKMVVLRAMTGKEADHGRGSYAMMTGYRPSPAVKHPSIGAVVSHELGARAGLPGYISVPGPLGHGGTGYLSSQFGSFGVGGDPASGNGFEVRDLVLPPRVDKERFIRRRRIKELVGDHFNRLETDRGPLDAMDSFYQQAYTMLSSEKVRQAFDLSAEDDKLKDAYCLGGHNGKSQYGKKAGMRLLLARRLVEAGARFVTVKYSAWDHHVQIREEFTTKMPAFDQALAALLTDLDERGLLESTLVMVCTEFGRSPKVNSSAGRDHYPRVYSCALAGGGLKRGLIYGNSGSTASEPEEEAVTVQDFFHTMYHLIGINADKELMAPGARPVEIVDQGNLVKEILA